jgi:hypothetical protein
MEDVRSRESVRVEERETVEDRRLHPRVPANLPVLIMGAGRIVVGRTEDASEGGLAVAVTMPLPELPSDVMVALRLPTQGWSELEGEIVRREPAGGVTSLLGIRLRGADPATGPRERRRRVAGAERLARRRPAPKAGESDAFEAELRALATLVYEQALNEPRAKPLRSLVVWANQLRKELGVEPSDPASYRDFLQALAELHRCPGRHGARIRPDAA